MTLPEIASIGIFNSSINRKNTNISKKRITTMFEIELPIENTGVSYINSNSMPINDNCIICAKPGQTRYTKFPFKCFYVHLIIKDGFLYNSLINLPDFIEISDKESYQKIYKCLVNYYDTAFENDEIILQSLVLKLIYKLSRDSKKYDTSQNFKSVGSTIIEEALKYIKNNLTEDLSLEALSSRFNLSPTHFHNIFKYNMGVTLREYVENQRIKKAINLLITTDFSLSRIAYECGFSSQSYFSFVFKRRFNTTPRKYAEEINILYEN